VLDWIELDLYIFFIIHPLLLIIGDKFNYIYKIYKVTHQKKTILNLYLGYNEL